MIKSRKRNQDAMTRIIYDFVQNNRYKTVGDSKEYLFRFVRYMANRIANGIALEDDCYFMDMLEDFERLEAE